MDQIERSSLMGGWDLVRQERVDLQGMHRSTGEDPQGKLIYSEDGSIVVVITKRQTEPLTIQDLTCYAGQFTFDGKNVHHQVKVSAHLKQVGLTLTRAVNLQGDILTLKSHPDPDGHFEITWKRSPA